MTAATEGTTGTRQRILEAGIGLWVGQDPATLFSGFSVARVAEAAHVTRSTFYSYWPSTAEYVADLVAFLIELDATNYPRIVAESPEDNTPTAAVTDVPGLIVEICSFHLKAAIHDPTLGVRLGFLSKADDPSVSAPLRELYRRSDALQYASFAVSLNSWGRELREPFTERNMQLIFSVLLEGLATRYRLDPDDFPLELYGWTITMLLPMITRRPDDDRDLFEIVDSLNSWPAIGLSTKLREHETRSIPFSPPIASGTMRDITIAIRRLLARVSFGELSISEIAVVTGYSELTLLQLFGSRPGIALCLLFINSFERYQQLKSEAHGLDRLRLLIDINRDELSRNPAIAQNMMLLLGGHTALPRIDLIDFDPRPMFTEAVSQAIERGELSRELDPVQFSDVLQRTLFIEGSQLAATTRDIDTVELLLRGAGAVPSQPQTTTTTVSPS